MAGERILFPEFRAELEFTKYPFADGASLKADTGHEIAKDTFLDASIYPIGAAARVYISRVVVTTRETTIVVSDSSRRDLASVVFDHLVPPTNLRLTDVYGRPAGILVSEPLRLARFSAWDVGTHTFAIGTTEFAASCVIPTPEIGVRGVEDVDENLITGDLWLLGDNGVVVREEGGHIRIDIVGDPLFVRKLCGPLDRFEVPAFIKTINGCPPDQYGNYNLTVGNHLAEDTIVRIYASDRNELVIEAIGQTNTNRGN